MRGNHYGLGKATEGMKLGRRAICEPERAIFRGTTLAGTGMIDGEATTSSHGVLQWRRLPADGAGQPIRRQRPVMGGGGAVSSLLSSV